jgi:hypothetical protein
MLSMNGKLIPFCLCSARSTIRIEWGQCDPAGIVFYPQYLIIFDTSTGDTGIETKRENIYRRGTEVAETGVFIHQKSFTSALSAYLRCCFL